MFTLRKVAVTTLVTLAGATGLLVTATSVGGALAQGDSAHGGASVLADWPWGAPRS